jgi:hypothetical protein
MILKGELEALRQIAIDQEKQISKLESIVSMNMEEFCKMILSGEIKIVKGGKASV